MYACKSVACIMVCHKPIVLPPQVSYSIMTKRPTCTQPSHSVADYQNVLCIVVCPLVCTLTICKYWRNLVVWALSDSVATGTQLPHLPTS
jgi:hypothetical protein